MNCHLHHPVHPSSCITIHFTHYLTVIKHELFLLDACSKYSLFRPSHVFQCSHLPISIIDHTYTINIFPPYDLHKNMPQKSLLQRGTQMVISATSYKVTTQQINQKPHFKKRHIYEEAQYWDLYHPSWAKTQPLHKDILENLDYLRAKWVTTKSFLCKELVSCASPNSVQQSSFSRLTTFTFFIKGGEDHLPFSKDKTMNASYI